MKFTSVPKGPLGDLLLMFWSSDVVYDYGAICFSQYDSRIYVSLESDNFDNQPAIGSTYWSPISFNPSEEGVEGQQLVKTEDGYSWENQKINAWSAETSYDSGDYCTYLERIYKSSDFSNLNNQPDTSPSMWFPIDFIPIFNGSDGQILTKTGDGYTDYEWLDPVDNYESILNLNSMTDLNKNTVFGMYALNTLGTSQEATAIGYEALLYNNPDASQDAGRYNTAVGYRAMRANTIGHHNTAVGWSSLAANTTGIGNTAVGEDALMSNNGGGGTAVGAHALYLSTTGADNTAVGGNALSNNTTGFYNTGIGANTGISNFGGVGTVQDDTKMTFLGALSSVDKSVDAGPFTNSTGVGYASKVNKSNMVRLGNSSTTVVETSGDFEATVVGKGFILKSPNGTRYRLIVKDDNTFGLYNFTTMTEEMPAAEIDKTSVVAWYDNTVTYNENDMAISEGNLYLSLWDDNTQDISTDDGSNWWPISFDPLTTGTTDQVLTKNSNSVLDYQWKDPIDVCNPKRMVLVESDFVYTTSLLIGAAISSGTTGQVVDAEAANHPGVYYLSDSTTAGGGYGFRTNTGCFLVAGGEHFVAIVKSVGTRSTASFRVGLLDATAAGDPTDGIFFRVANQSTNSVVGVCRSGGTETVTTSSYTLNSSTWYRFDCEVNAAGTSATFKILNSSGAVLFDQTVSSNLPTAAGRQTGFGIVATESTTDAAAQIVHIDYLSLEIKRDLIR